MIAECYGWTLDTIRTMSVHEVTRLCAGAERLQNKRPKPTEG